MQIVIYLNNYYFKKALETMRLTNSSRCPDDVSARTAACRKRNKPTHVASSVADRRQKNHCLSFIRNSVYRHGAKNIVTALKKKKKKANKKIITKQTDLW